MGTPAYLAPEVIMTTKGQTYDGKVTLCAPCCSGWVKGGQQGSRAQYSTVLLTVQRN